MWDSQVATLRDSLRLVRFDRRGHGFSSGLPDSSADAGDIAALCRQLKLGVVTLLGMSQGARGALRFASEQPERVAGLILDGPPSCNRETVDDDVPMEHFRELARTAGVEAFGANGATMLWCSCVRKPQRREAACAP
jgi:pimeloyl-ACP methyl ester carboxylesterase